MRPLFPLLLVGLLALSFTAVMAEDTTEAAPVEENLEYDDSLSILSNDTSSTNVVITEPATGFTWPSGDTRWVRWELAETPISMQLRYGAHAQSALAGALTFSSKSSSSAHVAISSTYEQRSNYFIRLEWSGSRVGNSNLFAVGSSNHGKTMTVEFDVTRWDPGTSRSIKITASGLGLQESGARVYMEDGNDKQTLLFSSSSIYIADSPYTTSLRSTTLSPGTYRVYVKTATGSAEKRTSFFKYEFDPAKLTITPEAPTTGYLGRSSTIKWDYTGFGSYTATRGQVDIDLVDALTNKPLLSGKTVTTNNDGYASYTIPSDASTSGKYKWRITHAYYTTVVGLSSEFTLSEATSIFTNPVAGQTITPGTRLAIRWAQEAVAGSTVAMWNVRDGSTGLLTSRTTNDGSYTWSSSTVQVWSKNYQIRIRGSSSSTVHDSGTFTIAGTKITVTSPTSSKTISWATGTSISWSRDGYSGKVTISESTTGKKLAVGISNSRTWSFVPNKHWTALDPPPTGAFKLAVSYDDFPGVTAGTTADIRINLPADVANANMKKFTCSTCQTVSPGDTLTISWTSSDWSESPTVVTLRRNDVPKFVIKIVEITSSTTRSVRWTVPQLPAAETYMIRLTAKNTGTAAETANPITIQGHSPSIKIVYPSPRLTDTLWERGSRYEVVARVYGIAAGQVATLTFTTAPAFGSSTTSFTSTTAIVDDEFRASFKYTVPSSGGGSAIFATVTVGKTSSEALAITIASSGSPIVRPSQPLRVPQPKKRWGVCQQVTQRSSCSGVAPERFCVDPDSPSATSTWSADSVTACESWISSLTSAEKSSLCPNDASAVGKCTKYEDYCGRYQPTCLSRSSRCRVPLPCFSTCYPCQPWQYCQTQVKEGLLAPQMTRYCYSTSETSIQNTHDVELVSITYQGNAESFVTVEDKFLADLAAALGVSAQAFSLVGVEDITTTTTSLLDADSPHVLQTTGTTSKVYLEVTYDPDTSKTASAIASSMTSTKIGSVGGTGSATRVSTANSWTDAAPSGANVGGTATPTSSVAPSSGSTPVPSSSSFDDDTSLPAGVYAGIAVGAVALLVTAVMVNVFRRQAAKKRRAQEVAGPNRFAIPPQTTEVNVGSPYSYNHPGTTAAVTGGSVAVTGYAIKKSGKKEGKKDKKGKKGKKGKKSDKPSDYNMGGMGDLPPSYEEVMAQMDQSQDMSEFTDTSSDASSDISSTTSSSS